MMLTRSKKIKEENDSTEGKEFIPKLRPPKRPYYLYEPLSRTKSVNNLRGISKTYPIDLGSFFVKLELQKGQNGLELELHLLAEDLTFRNSGASIIFPYLHSPSNVFLISKSFRTRLINELYKFACCLLDEARAGKNLAIWFWKQRDLHANFPVVRRLASNHQGDYFYFDNRTRSYINKIAIPHTKSYWTAEKPIQVVVG